MATEEPIEQEVQIDARVAKLSDALHEGRIDQETFDRATANSCAKVAAPEVLSYRPPIWDQSGIPNYVPLLLVVLVLVITFWIYVPFKIAGRSGQAKIAAAKTDVSAFITAIDSFQVDCDRFPTAQEGLAALVAQPANTPGWSGPYLRKLPIDPWGAPYVYSLPGTRNTSGSSSYDIFSPGPDGKSGTSDDIGNW